MRWLRRSTLLIGLLCIALVTLTSPAWGRSRDSDHASRKELQALLDEVISTGGVGAVLGLDEKGRELDLASGTSRLGPSRPLPANARFRAGSITKTFVSTVVLQLVAEGRLDLEDKVVDVVPGLLDTVEGADEIRVRMLLQHTSGVQDALQYVPIFGEEWVANRFREYTDQELVAISAQHPLLFAPGSDWSYSNTNYVIAGLLIERVTGRSWRTEIRRRILQPLRLRHTSLPGPFTGIPRPHAHAYMTLPSRERPVDITRQSMSWAGAAGELISTTADLNRFFTALLDGRLLPEDQLAEMMRAVEVSPGFFYGLGLYRLDLSCVSVWGHDGGVQGYVSISYHDQQHRRHVTTNAAVVAPPDAVASPETSLALFQVAEASLCGVPTTSEAATPSAAPAPTTPPEVLPPLPRLMRSDTFVDAG